MEPFRPIVATLAYVLSADRKQVLMIHRNKRADDIHFGKYNGLGGKLQTNEDVLAGLRRELYEEAGLIADEVLLRGTISWPGFGKHGEDWFGFIFRVESWHGTLHTGNHEGTLEWVSLASLETLPMWPSDRNFLPMVFDDNPKVFYGSMPFHNGEMVSWHYER